MPAGWLADARASGRPVIPLELVRKPDGKWEKRGYPTGWQRLSVRDAEALWDTPFGRKANGCAIAMGGGLYLIDLDYHSGDRAQIDAALRRWQLPPTREHRTPSGGVHLFYRVEQDMANRNKLLGLPIDGRGVGGNAAFGEPYEVTQRVAWHELPPLPPAALADILRPPASGEDPGQYPEPMPMDPDALSDKLWRRMTPMLAARFQGDKSGLRDKSRSGMDMSVAAMLASRGFTYDEIVCILELLFEHGVACSGKRNAAHEIRRTAWRASNWTRAAVQRAGPPPAETTLEAIRRLTDG